MSGTLHTSGAAPGYGRDAAQPQYPRMGFFTDTTVCIGCKACEVACKEWNAIPASGMELTGDSYDNTGGLGADTWRHVAFIEQRVPQITAAARTGAFTAGDPRPGDPVDLGGLGGGGFGDAPGISEVDPDSIDFTRAGDDGLAVPVGSSADVGFRWLMSSDVCKHCTTAACLDVCPTGSLFKTEFATVVVQEDICNGCGYCVPACPYGVLDRREGDGRVWKCTLCYDRLRDGQEPACAKACPTDSINFGTLTDMHALARERLDEVVTAGYSGAQLYGDGPSEGVDGAGSVFLLLDDPEVYGLPPDPIASTKHLGSMWRSALAAAGALALGVAAAALGGRR
ncbi:MAG TPA: 4Fe-4S dicluster domain-containing protein [Euzebyales bacterium]|nr:4Fe-4S dicluster domain-containing protein [Euzebyales bacterium]